MKRSSVSFVLATMIVIAVTFPLHLEGQAWVYVNDNYQAVGANTVSLFHFTGPALSYVSPYATTSTGIAFMPVPNQVVAAAYSSTVGCVFASDPLGDSSFPTGDVAAFKVHASGVLVRVGNYDDPTNTSGNNDLLTLAIDRRKGEPLLFAYYQAERKIASYKINTSTCALTWVSSTPATGLNNGWAIAMAVDNTPNNNDMLVVSYGDGSIQSFKNTGGLLTPTPAIFSAGFIGHGAVPKGLDITENGKWAVFADSNGPATELEVAPILAGGLGPTTDYPGLNAAQGSENVWLSPGAVGGKYYVYVTNNTSGDVSTFEITPAGIITPTGACGTGYTNPTPLHASLWSFPAGLHTTGTTASGGNLVVTEFGTPSSVALLKIQSATGCTAEVPGSPFTDSNSNNGLNSVDVLPSRPY